MQCATCQVNPTQDDLFPAAAAQLFSALRQLIARLYGTHGSATIVPTLSGVASRVCSGQDVCAAALVQVKMELS